MNAQTEALIEKVKSLPPEQRAEVEDFVDFLKTPIHRPGVHGQHQAPQERRRLLQIEYFRPLSLNFGPTCPGCT
jgi:hypothetical protein